MNDDTIENEDGGSLSSYIIVAIIAFALGLGSGYLWASKKVPTVSGDAMSGNNTGTEESVEAGSATGGSSSSVGGNTSGAGGQVPSGTMIARNALIVRDQLAGINVKVSGMSLSDTSWVVVREDDGEGAPGKILGAQLFDSDATSGTVELLRGTEIGGTYYAMIYTDNGDHAFDPKLDLPLLGDDGKPRMTTFKATDAAGDQTGTPTNI